MRSEATRLVRKATPRRASVRCPPVAHLGVVNTAVHHADLLVKSRPLNVPLRPLHVLSCKIHPSDLELLPLQNLDVLGREEGRRIAYAYVEERRSGRETGEHRGVPEGGHAEDEEVVAVVVVVRGRER